MNTIPVAEITKYASSVQKVKKKKRDTHKVPGTNLRIPLDIKQELVYEAEQQCLTLIQYILEIISNRRKP